MYPKSLLHAADERTGGFAAFSGEVPDGFQAYQVLFGVRIGHHVAKSDLLPFC